VRALKRPPLRYWDATYDLPAPMDYADVVAALVDDGFTPLGRAGVRHEDGILSLAKGYRDADKELFFQHVDRPSTVLTAPDGCTYADVSWFWGSPSIRMRTSLRDGSLVETLRQWDQPPGAPESLRRHRKNLDIAKEMTRFSVPERGRSIHIVRDATGAELWRVHQRHLAIYGDIRRSDPAEVRGMPGYLVLTERAFAHDWAANERHRHVTFAVVAAFAVAMLTGFGFSPVTVGVARGLLAIALGYLVAVVFTCWLQSSFRYLPRWLRPAYNRQPVRQHTGAGANHSP